MEGVQGVEQGIFRNIQGSGGENVGFYFSTFLLGDVLMGILIAIEHKARSASIFLCC